MNKRFVRAAIAACLLGSAAAVAFTASPAAAAAAGPSVSPAVGKLLQPAQKFLQAGDAADALPLIKQAQALPDLSEIDTFTINSFLASASLGLKDYATADTAYEAMADSPAMPAEEKAQTLHNATLLAAQYKHYDKAIRYGQAYVALGGPPDPALLSALAQSYYFSNDLANAQTTAQKAIDATPAGQAPNRGALEIIFGSQLKAKQQDQALATLEKMITYYNDPDDWGQLISNGLAVKGITDMEALDIYRLRLPTHATTDGDEYAVWGGLALANNLPVEADAIFQAGLSSGKLSTSGKAGAQIGTARSRAATDRKTIASFDAVARKSPGGELDAKLADTYFGYARYDDAIDAAKRALQKGGPKADPNQLNMIIGMSLAIKGDKAGATAAFNAVKTTAPGFARAVHLWTLYLASQSAAAAAH